MDKEVEAHYRNTQSNFSQQFLFPLRILSLRTTQKAMKVGEQINVVPVGLIVMLSSN